MDTEEIKQKEQKAAGAKAPRLIYFSVFFLIFIITLLSVLIYFLFFATRPQLEPSIPPTTTSKERKTPADSEDETKQTTPPAGSVDQVESDLKDLQSELDLLNQIEDELNSPDIDLDLGL